MEVTSSLEPPDPDRHPSSAPIPRMCPGTFTETELARPIVHSHSTEFRLVGTGVVSRPPVESWVDLQAEVGSGKNPLSHKTQGWRKDRLGV